MNDRIKKQFKKVELLERYYTYGIGAILPSEVDEFEDCLSEYLQKGEMIIESSINYHSNISRRVIRVRDGKVFKSIRKLSESLTMNHGYIHYRLLNNKPIKGEFYELINKH